MGLLEIPLNIGELYLLLLQGTITIQERVSSFHNTKAPCNENMHEHIICLMTKDVKKSISLHIHLEQVLIKINLAYVMR